jgi:hypothetical protein
MKKQTFLDMNLLHYDNHADTKVLSFFMNNSG